MRSIDGLKTITKDRILSYVLIESVIIILLSNVWAIVQPQPLTEIVDPLIGIWISSIMSFPLFLLVLGLLFLIPKVKEKITNNQQLAKVFGINIIVFLVVVVFQNLTIGPSIIISIFATFIDGGLVAFFISLLIWNITQNFSEKINNKNPQIALILFILSIFISTTFFGWLWLYGGLSLVPFEYQTILMIFPTLFILLPILTIINGIKKNKWEITGFYSIILLSYAWYYIFKLTNSSVTIFNIIDLPVNIILLVFSIGTVISYSKQLTPILKLDMIILSILLCWAKITTSIEKIVIGPIIDYGLSSIIILGISIFGLIIPFMFLKKKEKPN
ncbi:MAG: hypothetical protein ACTSUV_03500 [Candidatus Ranarchaeia archaeon]